jgi:hypothetical protein
MTGGPARLPDCARKSESEAQQLGVCGWRAQGVLEHADPREDEPLFYLKLEPPPASSLRAQASVGLIAICACPPPPPRAQRGARPPPGVWFIPVALREGTQ